MGPIAIHTFILPTPIAISFSPAIPIAICNFILSSNANCNSQPWTWSRWLSSSWILLFNLFSFSVPLTIFMASITSVSPHHSLLTFKNKIDSKSWGVIQFLSSVRMNFASDHNLPTSAALPRTKFAFTRLDSLSLTPALNFLIFSAVDGHSGDSVSGI